MKVPGLGCDVSCGPGRLVPAHGSWNLLEAVSQSSAGERAGQRETLPVCLLGLWVERRPSEDSQASPVPRTACRLDASPRGQAAREAGPAGGAESSSAVWSTKKPSLLPSACDPR